MAELWMSLRAYAKRRGVRLAAVQKAIESGRVTAVKRNPTGRLTGIEASAADQQWALNTDPVEAAKSGKVITPPAAHSVAAAPGGADELDDLDVDADSAPGAAGAGTGDAKDPGGFYEGRARRMQVQAEEAELDLLERKRQLVSAKEVEDQVFGIFRQARDRLQNIPARIAPRLAAESDATRVDQLLTDEIALVLDELSRDVEQLAAAGSAAGAAPGPA